MQMPVCNSPRNAPLSDEPVNDMNDILRQVLFPVNLGFGDLATQTKPLDQTKPRARERPLVESCHRISHRYRTGNE